MLNELTSNERELVNAFRRLLNEDQAEFRQAILERAKQRQREADELLKKLGVDPRKEDGDAT